MKVDPQTPSSDSAAALLERLRDIEAPPSAPWWPPAPGWWILALLLAAAATLMIVWILRRRAARRDLEAARRLLEELYRDWQTSGDERIFATGVHQLLRRVAISRAGRDAVARWTGRAFIDRVNALSDVDLSNEAAAWIAEAPYRADHASEMPIESVRREVDAWLAAVRRSRRA